MASLVVTKKMSSVGTIQLVVWEQQLGRLCEFVHDCIHHKFGFKRILVRSDNERSLLSLIERVTSNLTGVELVMMTSRRGSSSK